jgi:hypothetical protein
MAAKTNRRDRDMTCGATAPSPDLQRAFGTHFRASQHRDGLLEEAHELRRAGRIREARSIEKRAAQVEQLVGALEAEIRPPSPERRD